RPEHLELLLADLGVLLLHDDHADEVPARREVRGALIERVDLLHHLRDGVRGDLRRRRVVDAARDVAVRVRDGRWLEQSGKNAGSLLGRPRDCPAHPTWPGASPLYRPARDARGALPARGPRRPG